jgi:sec-independent protein translocase protein TatC
VLMLVLGWTGLIDPRGVSHYRKHYIFGAFVAAAVLTPTPDPFNMALLAIPLWLLFELGLIVMRIAYRRRAPVDQVE